MRGGIPVRPGDTSVAECAKRMGMAVTTLRNRLKDGRWIHRDGYIPVRVRPE